MSKAGACVLLSLVAGACGVGDDDNTIPDNPNPNAIQCTAAFKVTGTWTAAAPTRPTDPETMQLITGCWPVGTWTFSASVDPQGEALDVDGDGEPDRCGEVASTQAPTVAQQYSFAVDRADKDTDGDGAPDGWDESYRVLSTTPIHKLLKVKVTEGGGGECEGGLEMVSDDGKAYWNFKPTQSGSTTNTLGGVGEYTLFLEPQPY